MQMEMEMEMFWKHMHTIGAGIGGCSCWSVLSGILRRCLCHSSPGRKRERERRLPNQPHRHL